MNYSDFVEGIRLAYEHRGGIKTLRLGYLEPGWFADVQRDAAAIIEGAGSSDVSAPRHVTHWTRPKGVVRQFSLFNASGKSDEYTGDYGYRGDASKKRLVFPERRAISRFAALFGKSLRNLRLNGMGTESSLSAHEENSIEPTRFGSHHVARFHLPAFTSDQAFVYLDNERFHYAEGSVYFFNHGCVHAAANYGPQPRYHLVLDCFLDRNLFSRLFPGSPSPDPGFRKAADGEMYLHSEPHLFPEFVCEDGRVIAGDIGYGRRAPTMRTFYEKNYPSLFRMLRGAQPWAQGPSP